MEGDTASGSAPLSPEPPAEDARRAAWTSRDSLGSDASLAVVELLRHVHSGSGNAPFAADLAAAAADSSTFGPLGELLSDLAPRPPTAPDGSPSGRGTMHRRRGVDIVGAQSASGETFWAASSTAPAALPRTYSNIAVEESRRASEARPSAPTLRDVDDGLMPSEEDDDDDDSASQAIDNDASASATVGKTVPQLTEAEANVSSTAVAVVFEDEGELSKVNDIEVFYEVGSGAYGTVYAAECPRYDGLLALKALPRRKTERSRDASMVHEADVMSRLRHENIVRIHEAIDDPAHESVYLVMEFVDGKQAGRVSQPEGDGAQAAPVFTCTVLPEREQKLVARGVASALLYCQGRKVVHGDVKPENILLEYDPRTAGASSPVNDRVITRAKLADFGVGLALQGADWHFPDMPDPTPMGESVGYDAGEESFGVSFAPWTPMASAMSTSGVSPGSRSFGVSPGGFAAGSGMMAVRRTPMSSSAVSSRIEANGGAALSPFTLDLNAARPPPPMSSDASPFARGRPPLSCSPSMANAAARSADAADAPASRSHRAANGDGAPLNSLLNTDEPLVPLQLSRSTSDGHGKDGRVGADVALPLALRGRRDVSDVSDDDDDVVSAHGDADEADVRDTISAKLSPAVIRSDPAAIRSSDRSSTASDTTSSSDRCVSLAKCSPAVARGTPAFLAPELVTGVAPHPTPASDAWALGVTLFGLRYGYLPFAGGSRMQLCDAIVHADPRFPPMEAAPGSEQWRTERRWRSVLRGLLQKEPAARLTTRELLRTALLRGVQQPAASPARRAASFT